MKSSICTLFEGDYHYGVGALTNSLYHHGFRGVIWVGYRGKLPPWAKPLKQQENYAEYLVANGCCLRFVKLTTDYHLTNYKPNFMLSLWKEYCPETEAMFYFDPDIVIKCRWSYYEEWVSYGIALCEDVNSPLYQTHPLRIAWRKFYEPHGINLQSSIDTYVNGGFIGVSKQQQEFLNHWYTIQELMSPAINGLENANVKDRTFMFCKTDQDALNIALMSEDFSASIIGKEGMDFTYGGFTMSHALGSGKPWRKNVILNVIKKGKFPRLADKQYWKYVRSPIELYYYLELFFKTLDLQIGTLISRILCH